MASLSTIPSEILSAIIELVLTNHRREPESIEIAKVNRLDGMEFEYDEPVAKAIRSWDYGPQNVRHEQRATLAASTPLLCLNKAFHAQTKSALERLFSNGIPYSLDALFVNETELWTTWLSVPVLSTRLDTVDTTIRVIGESSDGGSAFRTGCGGPEPHVWLFYWLLEHFLKHGPVPATRESVLAKRRSMIIQNINIDVRAANEEVAARDDSAEARRKWRGAQRSCHRYESDTERSGSPPPVLHPRWFAKSISGDLSLILSVGYHVSGYSLYIYSQVGRFRVKYNGDKKLRTIDLGQQLADMFYEPDANGWQTTQVMGHLGNDCRITSFWNWKIKTMRRRRKNGLPVPELEKARWPSLGQWRAWRISTVQHQNEVRAQGHGFLCDGKRCYCNHTWLEDWLVKREATSSSNEARAN